MLTESFIAASSAPPKLTSSQSQNLKDAGIFHHVFQPQSRLEQFFKKSAAGPNSIACTHDHIFAAQAGKAAVHVYSREKANQEATVQFPEKIHSLTSSLGGTIILLGGEGGGVHVWETCSGRHIPTSQAHLQPVTTLASDSSGNFVLSGSDDANIHVWALLDLLTLPSHVSVTQGETKTPRHTLAGHRGPITSIVLGHSKSHVDIAISAARDETVIVWNYRQGLRLRTILLTSTALCLALDPGDRGLYAGLSDGAIQIVDFLATSGSSSIYETSSTPLQPDSSSRMIQSSTSPSGAVLSLALSYDSTTLVSGHESGKILSWDVGRPAFSGQLADYPGTKITNIQFLPPTGFSTAVTQRFKQHTIVKPKMNDAFSGPRGGRITGSYALSAQLPSSMPTSKTNNLGFRNALQSSIFSDDLLEDSIHDLRFPSGAVSNPTGAVTNGHMDKSNGELNGSTDFVALGSSDTRTTAEELELLRGQVGHLKNMQTKSFEQVAQLVKDKEVLRKQRDQAINEDEKRELKIQEAAVRSWGKVPLGGLSSVRHVQAPNTGAMHSDADMMEADG